MVCFGGFLGYGVVGVGVGIKDDGEFDRSGYGVIIVDWVVGGMLF